MEAQSGSAAGNAPSSLLDRLRQSSHPVAAVFFMIFRIAPLMLYLFGMLFTGNFVLVFILVAILLAADFWTVKNISGRLMVGLRWWNEASDDGSSLWVFETADPQRYINPIDSKLFWLLLYAVPATWVVFGFVAILKFEFLWLLDVALALVLTCTNTFAFSRCDKFSRANNILDSVSSNLAGRLFSSTMSRFWRS